MNQARTDIRVQPFADTKHNKWVGGFNIFFKLFF